MSELGLTHAISFTGSLWFDTAPDGSTPTLLLVESSVREPELEGRVLGDEVTAVVRERRPDASFVAEFGEQAAELGVDRIAAIGDGAILDAAKLAVLTVESGTGRAVELVLVPCGAEPYRAFTRFAVVDDGEERPTVVDERLGRATVVLVPDLLERLPSQTIARHALDSTVHAIESLLSSRSHPLSRAHAMAALRIIAEHSRGVDTKSRRSRADLIVASFLAAEAFSSTRLGLAHALASPLGTDLGMTHDALNGVLGEAVVEFWGADVTGFVDVASAVGLAQGLMEVRAWLASLRRAAGLPAGLCDLGVPWERVEAVLPRAARSSGVATLPRPLSDTGLVEFARRGWSGSVDEEVLHAGRP